MNKSLIDLLDKKLMKLEVVVVSGSFLIGLFIGAVLGISSLK